MTRKVRVPEFLALQREDENFFRYSSGFIVNVSSLRIMAMLYFGTSNRMNELLTELISWVIQRRVENTISFSPERNYSSSLLRSPPPKQTYYLKSFDSPSETITRSLLPKFPPRDHCSIIIIFSFQRVGRALLSVQFFKISSSNSRSNDDIFLRRGDHDARLAPLLCLSRPHLSRSHSVSRF